MISGTLDLNFRFLDSVLGPGKQNISRTDSYGSMPSVARLLRVLSCSKVLSPYSTVCTVQSQRIISTIRARERVPW